MTFSSTEPSQHGNDTPRHRTGERLSRQRGAGCRRFPRSLLTFDNLADYNNTHGTDVLRGADQFWLLSRMTGPGVHNAIDQRANRSITGRSHHAEHARSGQHTSPVRSSPAHGARKGRKLEDRRCLADSRLRSAPGGPCSDPRGSPSLLRGNDHYVRGRVTRYARGYGGPPDRATVGARCVLSSLRIASGVSTSSVLYFQKHLVDVEFDQAVAFRRAKRRNPKKEAGAAFRVRSGNSARGVSQSSQTAGMSVQAHRMSPQETR